MKQTAVKWVEDCLIEKYPNGSFVWNTRADLEALFKQAKEMEKQQIGEAYEDGYSDSDNTFELNKEYYNEKFKTK